MTSLTWDIDHHHVGAGGAGLVGHGADVLPGGLPGDAAQEESLVQDVDIVRRVLLQHCSLAQGGKLDKQLIK